MSPDVIGVLAAVFASSVHGYHIQGCFGIDNTTLDKWLELRQADNGIFLLKFDEQHAYGPKAEVFEHLCGQTDKFPKFFIAECELVQWGVSDHHNYDLRERYGLVGVHRDDFPVYFLHNDAHPNGTVYKGPIKHARLINWLRRYGINYEWDPRNLTEFEKKSEKFLLHVQEQEAVKAAHKQRTARVQPDGSISNDPSQRPPLEKDITKFEKMAKEYESFPISQTYLQMMNKVKQKGIAWISKEQRRVTRLLADHEQEGTIHDSKEEELINKLTVLNVYLEKLELLKKKKEEL
eukprot:gnl/MRDRNA2_/MRDRNA2_104386_c0_seq1.p1 gnl/MRDRNA2_/MRDRNA2_104386_c0~~gnl/MRDRNA2_/MRDRNA2_104386_c0_seq1.p1  ORF type:complete len:292 (-),score=61.97 gnl/MRDRNA2_/MRDRNA2_104386_c0_seq1:154-1029(-)